MNAILSGLTGTRCCVGLDYVVIYAKSLADHNVKLREVIDRLRTYWLKLQTDKCEFLRREINYMGHQITEFVIRPDLLKVPAIASFPTPPSVKELKILWVDNRRIISNCSKIASPLHKLLTRDVNFEWKQEQEHAFQYLKGKMTSQPILRYPDFAKEFILTTDVRNTGLGIVLSQGTLWNQRLHVGNYTTKEHYGYLKIQQLQKFTIKWVEDKRGKILPWPDWGT